MHHGGTGNNVNMRCIIESAGHQVLLSGEECSRKWKSMLGPHVQGVVL